MSNLPDSTRKGIRKTVIAICLIIVVILGLFVNKISRPRILSADELRANGVILFEKPRVIAPFNLTDQNNAVVDNSIFEGKWSLVFFGFSHCPDICPTTLADMTRTYLGLSDEQRKNTQLVFVTLDPARDNAELLKTYLAYFDEGIVGFTGDFIDILKFSRNVNIAFSKVTTEAGYTIDHSSNVILINPEGHFAGFVKSPIDDDKLLLSYHSIVSFLR